MATRYQDQLQRLSPGMYRNPSGGVTYSKTGAFKPQPNPTPAPKPAPQPQSQFDPMRAQTRIDYLKKIRPQDAQIGQLQKQIANNAQPQAGGTPSAFDPARAQMRIDYLKKIRPNDPEIAKLQNRISQHNSQQVAPVVNNTAPAPISDATPTPPVQQGPEGSSQSPMTKALMDALGKGLNTMQAYEPKNFEGSPLYQFQKQKGMQDLEKLMASRGLTNSGAEIQANSDFLANLNATEAEKQRQYADQAAQRAQTALQFLANYDRQERTDATDRQQFEANRSDRRDELGVNFLSNLLNLQAQNDVAKMSQTGLNNQTELTKALMQAITSNIGANASRSSGGGGIPKPPPPSGSQNDLALARILMGYGDNAGDNDVMNQILKQIF